MSGDEKMEFELLYGNLDNNCGYHDGLQFDALFQVVLGITYNSEHTHWYMVDHWNHRIRMLDLETNYVSTIAGNGENHLIIQKTPLDSSISMPSHATISSSGDHIISSGWKGDAAITPISSLKLPSEYENNNFELFIIEIKKEFVKTKKR